MYRMHAFRVSSSHLYYTPCQVSSRAPCVYFPAVSDAAFRSGSTLIDTDGFAYFVFDPFYNFLKNKEWKAKIDRTGQMLMDFFDAELRHPKRYPKKATEKKSNNPVRCIKVSMKYFDKEENEIEILPMKSKKDIL